MDCIYIAPLSKALYNLCLSFTHSHIHTHIHTPTAIGCHARYQSARQEQLGFRRLAQGHFDTPRVGSNQQPLRLPDNSSYLLSHRAPPLPCIAIYFKFFNLVANHTHISLITPCYCIQIHRKHPVPGGSRKDPATPEDTHAFSKPCRLY